MSLFDKFLTNLSPALYWHTNETSGTTLSDASGNGWSGTLPGGAVLGQRGIAPNDDGSSVLLPNAGSITSSYVPYPNGNAIRTWIALANRDTNTGADTIFGMSGGSGGYSLAVVNAAGDVTLTIFNGASWTWSAAWPGIDEDVLVELIHDLVASTAELWINGVSQGVKTGVTTAGVFGSLLRVGNADTSPGPWNGLIGPFAIIERRLTAKESAALWTVLPAIGEELYDDLAPIVDVWGDPNLDLKIYTAALGAMVQPVDDIAKDGPNGEPGWSQVLDINRADDAWLMWLGQWAGYIVPAQAATETEAAWSARERGKIVHAAAHHRATVAHLVEAIQDHLNDPKQVIIQERVGDAHTINVYVFNSQIATSAARVEAAARAQKAAGLIMNFTVLTGANYTLLQASNTSYTVMSGKHANYNSVLTNPGL